MRIPRPSRWGWVAVVFSLSALGVAVERAGYFAGSEQLRVAGSLVVAASVAFGWGVFIFRFWPRPK